MKNIVPYEKEIKFNSKIAEICSISLEHELNLKDDELEGNFIINGEYKTHELSINKEKFNYKLPFSVEMTDNIDKDSVDFEINDFTYEIVNDDILKVNIEFSVIADEKEDNRVIMMDEINQMFLDENPEQEVEEVTPIEEENPTEENNNEEKVEEPEEIEKRLSSESEELIVNSANEKENEFATYHIHIVKSGDTVETICTFEKVDLNLLKEYNNMENINVGDKIIIPELDE